LTTWVGEELIPSSPKGLSLHPIGHNITKAALEGAIQLALVQFTRVMNTGRANQGIRCLAEAIGLDDSQLFTATAEAIYAIAR
jgi:hypothetical protein